MHPCQTSCPTSNASTIVLNISQSLHHPSRCYPLTSLALQRSLVYSGNERLRRVVARARRGEHVLVAVVGGSVASGGKERS